MATDSWLAAGALDDEPRVADVSLPSGVTLDDVALAASQHAWRRTGCRYGLKVRTGVRPILHHASCQCGFARLVSVDLGPDLVSVQAVVVDGVPLAPSAYVVVGNLLVRQDGGVFPCQSLTTPAGQVGTWSVDLTRGAVPPPDGVIAVRELAIHIAHSLAGNKTKLPARAASVGRQGVVLNLAKVGKLTGIGVFDDFVVSANPNGLTRRSTVSSPDRMRRS